jgi:UDP-N-acetylglucosamine 4-epimerase
LAEFLLKNNQVVVGIDNFFNSTAKNIDTLQLELSASQKQNFTFIEGDICDESLLLPITKNVDVILHQAAAGSVSRSLAMPHVTFKSNIEGFFNVLNCARKNNVKKIVYASSSSVYGDSKDKVKIEGSIGKALSPYAWSKQTNETLAENFKNVYGMHIIGLRYFNVFGPRQNPNGDYAAVIPRWTQLMKQSKICEIYGDGLQGRDFCFIENVIQANVLAALNTTDSQSLPSVFNIAYGETTSLLRLFELMKAIYQKEEILQKPASYEHRPPRTGDILNSLADISRAKEYLKYSPDYNVKKGLEKTLPWYLSQI